MSVEVRNELSSEQWQTYGEVYAFVGNELLQPMNRSGVLRGIDPSFWRQMPIPGNERGERGMGRLEEYAVAAKRHGNSDDPNVAGMLGSSVEYTKLFIGPPKPAAAPWETMNDPQNKDRVGFGQSTLAMKQLLAEAGLELSGESNQYEDHMGVELLYLAALCERAADGEAEGLAPKVAWFIEAHPLFWMGRFRANVDAACSDGYYSALLEYVEGVLEDQVEELTGV